MRPFVGERFGQDGAPRLLLIGESHYLPEGSTVHLNPDAWYSGSEESLTDHERGWISTKDVIAGSRANGFRQKEHSIWRLSLQEINASGPNFSDFVEVAGYISFYNFFLRPAVKGKSLQVQGIDVSYANEAFLEHLHAIRPTAVVFISRLARKHCPSADACGVPVVATPHPSCVWWNRTSAKYGHKRGRDILGDLVRELNWRS